MKQLSNQFGPHRGTGLRLAGALALLALCAPDLRAQDAPQGYVQAAARGATVRNLGDLSGHPILRVEPGGVLAVYGKRGDWLQVEAPGGFEVWVYGKYVSATRSPGVLQVSGNHVNMRPKPSSDVDSFPLPKPLFAGDRVKFLGRADASAAWDEDWIRIASPAGVRAWVPAVETEAVDSTQGARTWSQAAAAARALPPADADGERSSGSGGGDPSGATPQVRAGDSAEAKRALRRADDFFSAERAKTSPDLERVRAGYAEVLELVDTGATADLARAGLARVDALAEARALQAELEAERLRRETEAERYRREIEAASARRDEDPFEGRYSYRGWVERIPSGNGKAARYLVRFGGRQIVELVCSSGRYDLDDFADFDIGVRGVILREPVAAPDGVRATLLPSLDVARIEVLSGRNR